MLDSYLSILVYYLPWCCYSAWCFKYISVKLTSSWVSIYLQGSVTFMLKWICSTGRDWSSDIFRLCLMCLLSCPDFCTVVLQSVPCKSLKRRWAVWSVPVQKISSLIFLPVMYTWRKPTLRECKARFYLWYMVGGTWLFSFCFLIN